MTESRLAAILAEDTPPFWRRPDAPRRQRRRPIAAFFRRSSLRILFLVPVVGLFGWVLSSPEFAVNEVEVIGSKRVAKSWIDDQLAAVKGRNLVSLSIKSVRESLLGHPWIETVQVRKDLPARLIVQVVEHQPAAVLVRDKEGYLVTEGGLVFSRTDLRRKLGLLRIVESANGLGDLSLQTGSNLIGRTPPEVQAALVIVSDLKDVAQRWQSALLEVRVLGRDEFELRFDGSPGSVLVDSQSAKTKAQLLDGLLPQIVERYTVDSYDLRFGNRIVLRGATALPADMEVEQGEKLGREGA